MERRQPGHGATTGWRPSSTAPIPPMPGTSPGSSRACSRTGTTPSAARCTALRPARRAQGADDYELVFETQVPAPYLPAMLLYSCPLSKAALAEHGPLYNTKPETAVSSGPFILNEWAPDQQIIYVKNEKYTGTLKPPVNKVVMQAGRARRPTSRCTRTTRSTTCESPAPADPQLMLSDERPRSRSTPASATSATYYLFFDVTKAPFDDLEGSAGVQPCDRPRRDQAADPRPQRHAGLLLAAPGSRPPTRGAEGIQNFDVADGEATAGRRRFPGWRGLPEAGDVAAQPEPARQDGRQRRGRDAQDRTSASRRSARTRTRSFMAALTPNRRRSSSASSPTAWTSSTRTTCSASGSRADATPGPTRTSTQGEGRRLVPRRSAERIEMFQDAEKILVEDVPGVFVYHETPVQLIKPWVKGDSSPRRQRHHQPCTGQATTMSTVRRALHRRRRGRSPDLAHGKTSITKTGAVARPSRFCVFRIQISVTISLRRHTLIFAEAAVETRDRCPATRR